MASMLFNGFKNTWNKRLKFTPSLDGRSAALKTKSDHYWFRLVI